MSLQAAVDTAILTLHGSSPNISMSTQVNSFPASPGKNGATNNKLANQWITARSGAGFGNVAPIFIILGLYVSNNKQQPTDNNQLLTTTN